MSIDTLNLIFAAGGAVLMYLVNRGRAPAPPPSTPAPLPDLNQFPLLRSILELLLRNQPPGGPKP
jgi:hypothetical protein